MIVMRNYYCSHYGCICHVVLEFFSTAFVTRSDDDDDYDSDLIFDIQTSAVYKLLE